MVFDDGSNHRLEQLFRKSSHAELQDFYKRHDCNNIQDLVEEIRRDGSNTFATVFRGGDGVHYAEIVADVADKVGVKYSKDTVNNEMELELLIIIHLIRKHFDKMSPEERANLEKNLVTLSDEYKEVWAAILKGSATLVSSLIATIGIDVFVAALRQLIATILARTLVIEGGLLAARMVTLAVPFLNVIMGAWLVFDISGPAYRKTVPTVFHVGLLRLQYA
ncbi:hypothetical protein [Desulfolutivibrio sulfoxidireducens]|uniref:hypothetical protein n=1 Tax=Desulfolutivibrio sulfoxidireducens TaxID=2773299 RepID=UPI00159DE7B5|nr:hypothetical protein [Desulfolutivibrio sulfoxidireducens]QLA15799.1 hypothetical protein GD605_06385 [Desulfolutivibrio sulfoxidireducens]